MTEMGHIAYQSIRLAETNVLTPIPRLYWDVGFSFFYLYLFLIKRY